MMGKPHAGGDVTTLNTPRARQSARSLWDQAAGDFADARAERAGALDGLAAAVQQLRAAELAADGQGAIVLISLHHGVGKAWQRVQAAHRRMLVAGALMDDAAAAAGMPATERR
jgi:hypothetical protein